MSEYIKKEDAVIEVERFGGYLDDDMLYRIKLALGRLPSADVVEVVRCKDCKYWWEENELCRVSGIEEKAGDYCSYGEE